MLIGITCRQKESLLPADVSTMNQAGIEAVKTTADVQAKGAAIFLQPQSDSSFAKTVKNAYSNGVEFFIIHRHPNRSEHGLGKYWRDGKEFASWWIDVWARISQECPKAKFGIPAMRPGEDIGGIQADSEQFFDEAREAVQASDFYELEVYWKTPEEMKACLWRIDSYLYHWPDKPMIIEFCNPNSNVKKETKGEQYLEFYREMTERPQVLAAFAYCISSPDPLDKYVTWRGESGNPNAIPRIIGGRNF